MHCSQLTKSTITGRKKKKKKNKRGEKRRRGFQLKANGHRARGFNKIKIKKGIAFI